MCNESSCSLMGSHNEAKNNTTSTHICTKAAGQGNNGGQDAWEEENTQEGSR